MSTTATPRPAFDGPVDATRPPERELARLLLLLDRERHLSEPAGPLHAAEIRLLWLLGDGRPRTLREIAEALEREQSTVNRQVNAALRDGLVRRFTVAGESAARCEPTALGRRRFDESVAHVLDVYRVALGDLGDDARQFVTLLGRFVAGYGRAVRDQADSG